MSDNKDILVSVIIPIYNIETYVKNCVKSVMAQTHANLEIILVNDGSTDASGIICDELKQQDDRIQVLHKKNGGIMSARKAGLKAATGGYVSYVDGDDWIAEDLVEQLLKAGVNEDADVITSGHIREYENRNTILVDTLPEGVYRGEREKQLLFSHLLYNESIKKAGIRQSVWAKLFRMDLAKEVILNLNDNIKYGDDAAITYICCIKAKCVVITHGVYYHYIMREGSITHSTDKYYLHGISHLYLAVQEAIENSKYCDLLAKQWEAFIIKRLFLGINRWIGFSKESSIPEYCFDEAEFEKDARVVLYGAGRIGQSFYKQLLGSRRLQLVGWVDRDYEKYQKNKLNVVSVDMLGGMEYDVILLAFNRENMAMGVREHLQEMGIDAQKIAWQEPEDIIEKYIKL